jgi:hypothetical protein
MALVVTAAAAQKAKLQAKGKLRPHAMVRKKLPDGAELIDKLPERAPGAREDDEDADAEYCAAISKVSDVFGKSNRSQTTADEHKAYTRMIDGWLVRKGFLHDRPRWCPLDSMTAAEDNTHPLSSADAPHSLLKRSRPSGQAGRPLRTRRRGTSSRAGSCRR